MYTLPQETTALKPYDHKRVTDAITAAIVANDGSVVPLAMDDGYPIPHCYIVTPKCKSVPIFHVPLRIETSASQTRSNSEIDLCVDMRSNMRETRTGVQVTNLAEHEFSAGMMRIVKLWVDGEFGVINNFCQEPLMRLWVRWLATALVTRLNILETVQPNVNIIVAWYYYCLSNPTEDKIPSAKLPRIAQLIAKTTFTNPTLVTDIITKLPHVTNLDGLITLLKEHSGTDRFDNLTPGFLFTLTQYSWFGSSAIQFVSASLECPALFVAMVWGAGRFDAYRKTPIGKLVKDLKTQEAQTVQHTVDKLLED